MAFNASDDGQINTLIFCTARFCPTLSIYLQRASDYSLDGNADASTTNFRQEKYKGIKSKYLLSHHIPHLMTGRRYKPIGS